MVLTETLFRKFNAKNDNKNVRDELKDYICDLGLIIQKEKGKKIHN